MMKFKSLNSLRDARSKDFFGHLLQAVRMHYFPYAVDAAAAHAFEVDTGLVQNLTLAASDEKDTHRSPIRLPPFSIELSS